MSADDSKPPMSHDAYASLLRDNRRQVRQYVSNAFPILVIADPSMPPGCFEMRSGDQRLVGVLGPLSRIIDEVNALALKVLEQTARSRGVTRISLASDVGLSFGIPPGTSVDLHTAGGTVEIYCEATPRYTGTVTVPR